MGNSKEKQFIILIVLLLATCLVVYGMKLSSGKVGKKTTLASYFGKIGEYTPVRANGLTEEVYNALDLDDYISTGYIGKDGAVSLYIGYYYSLDKVSAAHSPLVCFPGQGWTIDQPAIHTLKVGEHTVQYAEIVASILENKSLIMYWYQAHNLTSPYIYRSKMNTLLNKLTGKKEEHAFVRISIPFSQTTRENAEKTGIDFIKAFYPRFIQFVDENDAPAILPVTSQ